MKLTPLLFLTAGVALAASAPNDAPKTPARPSEAATAVPASAHGSSELAGARKELALLTARHGEKHHLVIKQRRKVAELQKKVAGSPSGGDAKPVGKERELEAAKQDLAALRERYTDQHPLVKNKLQRIAELEGR